MTKIPEFKSEEEESDFWDSHSATEFFDETKPIEMHFVDARPRKTLISLRLDTATISQLKQAGHRRGMGYQTLIRMWILEHLAQEGISTAPTGSATRELTPASDGTVEENKAVSAKVRRARRTA